MHHWVCETSILTGKYPLCAWYLLLKELTKFPVRQKISFSASNSPAKVISLQSTDMLGTRNSSTSTDNELKKNLLPDFRTHLWTPEMGIQVCEKKNNRLMLIQLRRRGKHQRVLFLKISWQIVNLSVKHWSTFSFTHTVSYSLGYVCNSVFSDSCAHEFYTVSFFLSDLWIFLGVSKPSWRAQH